MGTTIFCRPTHLDGRNGSKYPRQPQCFPLESLIGAFTLNEKLQFINELFDGSSDDFSTNIKQLDQLASMDAARNMLAELAQTFNWDTESEIVEDFIYKICRRHAAGA
jgi:hypothetical protein